jgi:hypothetical protein
VSCVDPGLALELPTLHSMISVISLTYTAIRMLGPSSSLVKLHYLEALRARYIIRIGTDLRETSSAGTSSFLTALCIYW